MPFLDQVFEGQLYDFSHGEINIADEVPVAIQSFNCKQELKPGVVKNRKGQIAGFTRGELSLESSIELLMPDLVHLIELLGDGWGEKKFNILAVYTAEGMPTIKKEANGCRLTSDDFSSAIGSDALKHKVDIMPMEILINGLSIIAK